MIELWKKIQESKFGQFIIKYHLIYLAIPFCFWGIKALLYNIAIWVDPPVTYFHFAIDEHIPFIKYFFIFYSCYYYLPQIALWILSFFDKKKYWVILSTLGICTFICFIFYLTLNVAMVRQPGYPNGITLKDVKDISTFFDFCINYIYSLDSRAMNCFPSLHAIVGMMLVLIGIYVPHFDKRKLPIALRIVSIVCGIGCVLSTIFIKQHYFIDMMVGIILSLLIYALMYFIFYRVEQKKKKTNSCITKIEEV